MDEEYKVKQLAPSHATHISHWNDKFLLPMFEHEIVVAQPKYDGERMLIHFNKGEVYCTSRRFSKKTGRYMENQDKLPILQQLAQKIKHLDYTVIDCECYAKNWSTIVGILHSLPERAIELQKNDIAQFAVFDCLFYDGKDLRERPYIERLAYTSKVVNDIDYQPLRLIEFMNESYQLKGPQEAMFIKSNDDWQRAMNKAVYELGFEGIVIKSLQKTYYDKGALLKCKKFETVDCVITGYQEGNGKYANSVGAMEIGYYDKEKDKFITISRVNCGTDAEREDVNQHRDEYLHSVVEIKCQEITDKSLRHPVFVRFRPDKSYTMCTKDTIFKEAE